MPVRVLEQNLLVWFHNLPNDFSGLIKDEIIYNNLKNAILLRSPCTKIENVAEINSNHQIILYENFNQFLWCICYALFELFDKGIVLPSSKGAFSGFIEPSNPELGEAFNVLQAGLDLCDKYVPPNTFIELDNPEELYWWNKDKIGVINAIYVSSLGFVLMHEFSHQYLGHLSHSEITIKEESNADKCAIEFIKPSFLQLNGKTNQIGVGSALCSLILLTSSLSGGSTHPDSLDRLENALHMFGLSRDDEIWGYASVALVIWHHFYYKGNLDMPKSVDCYSDLFECTKIAIKNKF